MTFEGLLDAVSADLPQTEYDEIRLLLGRLPKERYHDFLSYYRGSLTRIGTPCIDTLAESIIQFNNALVEAGNRDEVLEDLEEKLARLTPALLEHGLLSATPPTMSWAIIQNHYRLVVNTRMLLFDFTKTEFTIIQTLKLDRAVRLIHRDAGEFLPYARKVLESSS